MTPPRRP